MKITIEHEGHKATLEDESIVDICDAIDLMAQAFIGVGYEPQRLRGAFIVKAEEIQNADK